jgi:hypothetical protein
MQGVFVLPCGNGERAVTSRSSNDADEPGFLVEILDNLCRVCPDAIEFRLVSKANPGHSENCGRSRITRRNPLRIPVNRLTLRERLDDDLHADLFVS